jgi:FtsP/CotA-like multicopper oxidase with cupredoxin domain
MRVDRIVGVLAPLAAVFLGGAAPHVAGRTKVPTSRPHAPGERVVPNDNRRSAGILRGDTLFVRLVLRNAEWFPQADSGPSMVVAALAEEGGPPVIPAPLIRAREGTVIDVTIRNELPGHTAESRGLVTHPSMDSTASPIPPGDSLHRRFAAGAPGTYLYTTVTPDEKGLDLRDTPNGAFIVDPAGGSKADRVLVINGWTQAVDSLHSSAALAFNGRVWPFTEHLTAQVGDTLRWRVVNATDDLHPLHLHGHYFRVATVGTGMSDSVTPLSLQRQDVTQPLFAYQTMSLEWTAQTPGNWLFHCHLTFHVDPAYAGMNVLNTPEGAPAHHQNGDNEPQHMSGLVLGIRVTPRPGAREVARGKADQYRLLVQEGRRRGRAAHSRGFVLQHGAAPATDSIEIPGTTLLFTRGKAADVVVVNHLPEDAAIHWHGLELESYSDGAAGWSGVGARIARSIAPGDSFTAHLTLRRAGTFMYHTHLNDMEQLTSGLYGALIVLEPGQHFDPAHDHVYVGSWDGREDPPHYLVNGDSVGGRAIELTAGERQRFRFIGIGAVSGGRFALMRDTTHASWRMVAKDGADLPPAVAAQWLVAEQRVLAGETFDFEWTPEHAGVYTLRAAAKRDAVPWTQQLIVR